MSDLIDRQGAIDLFESYIGLTMKADDAHHQILYILKSLPSAERTGTWIGEWDGYDMDGEPIVDIWRCSVCDKVFDEWDEKPDWKYCPNCGAKMENPEDEEE